MVVPRSPQPPDCNGRFTIQAFLGSGGMGAVYAAYDHERQSPVAIKVARDTSAPWLYRFKQEFRSLAGIVHPNLVTLHELIEWEGQWLFTMERVSGVSFSDVRRAAEGLPTTSPMRPADCVATTHNDGTERTPVAEGPAYADSKPLFSDSHQIGDAVCQLCDGLDFLHESGLAHGDMKPSNALVTPAGRVVILDFGIAREWKTGEDDESAPFLGTPGYMAPERLDGQAATPATDMYAVGVMLFEALCGHSLGDVADPEATLRASRRAEPGGESAVDHRERLERLSCDLMNPDPVGRPTAAEAREAAVFGARPGPPSVRAGPALESQEPGFVARQAEVERARNLLLDRRPDAPRVVLVSGESGIGKSEVMRRVVHEQLPGTCIVLEGKCYEREHVPYRALDRIVDLLSSKLLAVEGEEIEALAWADLAIVARMFPVLLRVPEIDRICVRALRSEERDPVAQRRVAAQALGRLMGLIANGRRLIVYIDDLHWGDEESAIVLRDLLQHPEILDLRVAGCHRHTAKESRFVSALKGDDDRMAHAEVAIGALALDEAAEVARAMLGPEAETGHVMRIAEESHGNPFLIRELVSFGAGRSHDELELRSAVARHVDLLSQPARRVLEILAVAARPLHIEVIREATGIGQTLDAALILLRSQHLIKTSDDSGLWVEPYHDRIREVTFDRLEPQVNATRHAELVSALEHLGHADPATLAFHLEGAGELARAGEAALRAAALAEASLAHLNAAKHYGNAAELIPEEDPRHRVALHARARNLSAAGRAATAAPIYMHLALGSEPDEALELRRTAAEAWVYAGEFEKARAVLPAVFRDSGVKEARTRLGAVLGILRRRLWLKRRGYRYAPVAEADVKPERIVRIDAYENACELWNTIDLIRAYHAHLSQVRESLMVGEPRRVARALVETVVGKSIAGERVSQRGHALLQIAIEASGMGDFPEERALIRYGSAVHAALNGRYADVVSLAGDLASSPDLSRTVRQQRTLRSVLGYSRWWLGDWRTLCKEYRSWIADAVERGDRLSTCTFRLEQGGRWEDVLQDEPERAITQITRDLDSPVGRELSFGHLAARQAHAWISLYMGRPEEALRQLHFERLEKAFLRVQRSRVEVSILRIQAELARGPSGLRGAKSGLRRLEKEGVVWSGPILRLMSAAIAELEGRRYESIAALELAISECKQLGYAMFAAAATWRLGQLDGGAEGEALRLEAREKIADQGARRPDRIVRALAPGFGDVVG